MTAGHCHSPRDEIFATKFSSQWYVQAVLNRVWTHGKGLDSVKCVDKAVEEIVAEAEPFYLDLLRSQTSAEQSILKAVGRESPVESISASDFIKRNALPSASTVRSAAAKLKERDLIYKTDAGHVIYDRFFGVWLKHMLPGKSHDLS